MKRKIASFVIGVFVFSSLLGSFSPAQQVKAAQSADLFNGSGDFEGSTAGWNFLTHSVAADVGVDGSKAAKLMSTDSWYADRMETPSFPVNADHQYVLTGVYKGQSVGVEIPNTTVDGGTGNNVTLNNNFDYDGWVPFRFIIKPNSTTTSVTVRIIPAVPNGEIVYIDNLKVTEYNGIDDIHLVKGNLFFNGNFTSMSGWSNPDKNNSSCTLLSVSNNELLIGDGYLSRGATNIYGAVTDVEYKIKFEYNGKLDLALSDEYGNTILDHQIADDTSGSWTTYEKTYKLNAGGPWMLKKLRLELKADWGATRIRNAVFITTAEELAFAKDAAKQALAGQLTTYHSDDYSSENWTLLGTAKSNGETNIDNASDLTGVNTAKNNALTAMAAVKTLLQEAKETAKQFLTDALSGYNQSDYRAADWTVLRKAKTDGDAAINNALSLDGVETAKINAVNGMAAVKTDAVLKAEELATAKSNAKQALNDQLASYVQADYSSDNLAALNKVKTEADAAIDSAENPADIETVKINAINGMNAVKTNTQIKAEELEAAKTEAKKTLFDSLSGYVKSKYTSQNWAILNKAKTDGDAAIDNASTIEEVDKAKTDALSAMAKVSVIPPVKNPAKPNIKITKVKVKKKFVRNRLKISWKKVGGQYYTVMMSKKQNSGYSTVKKYTKDLSSFTKTGLKKNTTYYFKVRTYKVVNGQKYYSSYSLVRKMKA